MDWFLYDKGLRHEKVKATKKDGTYANTNFKKLLEFVSPSNVIVTLSDTYEFQKYYVQQWRKNLRQTLVFKLNIALREKYNFYF